MSALHAAVENNSTSEVSRLVRLGHDVNSKNEKGQTPLHIAAVKKNTAMVKLLCELGADPSIRNQFNETPLFTAFIKHYGPSNDKDMIHAVDIMEVLLEHGAKIEEADSDGWNILHASTARRKLYAIRKILEAGMDVDSLVEETGQTPLSIAVEDNSVECAKLLLNAGADFKKGFRNPVDIPKFFDGDLSWWKNPPQEIKRIQKVKNIFNK